MTKPPVRQPPSRRVVLVQTAMDDYRQAFVNKILCDDRLHILVGTNYFTTGVETRLAPHERITRIQNLFLAGRRLSWQRGAVTPSIRAHLVVLELNPRILSNWVVLIVRWLVRRRTLLWGHAWSRSGPAARTEPIRAAMRKLASCTLVYTASDAESLQDRYPRLRVKTVVNAIMPSSQMIYQPPTANVILYSGRLVKEKKPDLLVRAFAKALPDLPHDVRLVFVGTGPLRSALDALVKSLKLENCVSFEGRLADTQLSRIYEACRVSVSPGYVGLALIQSLGHGRPMVIADREPHAPEIEAARAGENSVFFRSDSESSLSDALKSVFAHSGHWAAAGPSIATQCREQYSVDQMASQFLDAVSP